MPGIKKYSCIQSRELKALTPQEKPQSPPPSVVQEIRDGKIDPTEDVFPVKSLEIPMSLEAGLKEMLEGAPDEDSDEPSE